MHTLRRLSLIAMALFLSLAGFSDAAANEIVLCDPPQKVFLPLILTIPGGIQTPLLKWQNGGCYSAWCEMGWYASPAVGDINADGRAEVIGATYSIFALDGKTGALKWRTKPDDGRAWPGIGLADINGNGKLEIVVAQGNGTVNVLNSNGSVRWSKQPTPGQELRSLALDDLDGDGQIEALVASTASNNQWWVYRADGSLYAGNWPQKPSSPPGYAAGAYNENIGVADLDRDGRGEIIGPNDTHYITAYEDDGAQMQAAAIFNNIENITPVGSPKVWSQVGVHVDPSVDLRGYAECGVEHRPNFANSAPSIADLDGNGSLEIVIVGNVYNCGTDPYTDLYEMPFVFNGDRTRWQTSEFNWSTIPIPDGQSALLSEDWERIENSLPNPVLVDLDSDGKKEILYPSYDGRMHAYWLDKLEHGSWPYAVNRPGEGVLRFASEPAVADLDGDGQAEVIFASWTEKGSGKAGKLHLVSALGEKIAEVDLPVGDEDWNGGLAAPTLADIDGDGELEAVVNTSATGMVAYDLPGTWKAIVLWGTGRGSYLRQGQTPE